MAGLEWKQFGRYFQNYSVIAGYNFILDLNIDIIVFLMKIKFHHALDVVLHVFL